ncbi:MAG: ATP-binding protein, partial [Nitrososphaera sp.]|nr:ATP-binding protein [Nitrososphaera sp.]
EEASSIRVAYLPPMSGLADREFIKQPGEIGYLIGQGQTAQTLRNICYQVFTQKSEQSWRDIVERIELLFGVKLRDPIYIAERSEITMDYEERGCRLDLSSAGRGLQQTLLLLAYLYANPSTVLLIDEPDAHLEILRQRQIYQLLTEIAEKQASQVIAASHSEVVLGEAAGRGKVVAFVGSPHVLNDRGSQVMKSLTEIGWDLYYQAESMGWILFLEGPSDLAILQAFANTLNHEARLFLERPFVHYVTNVPKKARDLFFGLQEAKGDLVGIAIFDRLDQGLAEHVALVERMWTKRELENYFCMPEILMTYARGEGGDDLFSAAESEKRESAMKQTIQDIEDAMAKLGKPSPWSPDT